MRPVSKHAVTQLVYQGKSVTLIRIIMLTLLVLMILVTIATILTMIHCNNTKNNRSEWQCKHVPDVSRCYGASLALQKRLVFSI